MPVVHSDGSVSLRKRSILADSLINGEFSGSDQIRRISHLHGKGIRDPDHFRRQNPFSGYLAERLIHSIEGQICCWRNQTLHRSHLVQLITGDQKTHKLVGHIQILTGVIDRKLYRRAVNKIASVF